MKKKRLHSFKSTNTFEVVEKYMDELAKKLADPITKIK